jgi:hypothetical protein
MKIVLELLALYFLYKLIFDLIIPAYHTGKEVKKKVSEMQESLNQFQQHKQQEQQGSRRAEHQKPPTSGKDDYIEYEEVK